MYGDICCIYVWLIVYIYVKDVKIKYDLVASSQPYTDVWLIVYIYVKDVKIKDDLVASSQPYTVFGFCLQYLVKVNFIFGG